MFSYHLYCDFQQAFSRFYFPLAWSTLSFIGLCHRIIFLFALLHTNRYVCRILEHTNRYGGDDNEAESVLSSDKAWWHFWQCSHCQTDLSDNSEKARAAILEAAFQEMHRVGFQAASLKNILKQTQSTKPLTKGALYHHFPNKQALGYAVVDEIIRGMAEQHWIEPLKNADDPIDALQQSIRLAGQQMTEEDIELGCPLNNLSQEMSGVDEQFRLRTEAIYRDWRQAIVDALEDGKKNGVVLEQVNSEEFAIVFVATLEGCLGLAKSSQSIELLMSCGKGLIDLLETLRNL